MSIIIPVPVGVFKTAYGELKSPLLCIYGLTNICNKIEKVLHDNLSHLYVT